MGLCSRRDLEIEKMTKDVKREESILWHESVCTLLEMNDHWSGHARILEQPQKERVKAPIAWIVDIARDHKAGIANLSAD